MFGCQRRDRALRHERDQPPSRYPWPEPCLPEQHDPSLMGAVSHLPGELMSNISAHTSETMKIDHMTLDSACRRLRPCRIALTLAIASLLFWGATPAFGQAPGVIRGTVTKRDSG